MSEQSEAHARSLRQENDSTDNEIDSRGTEDEQSLQAIKGILLTELMDVEKSPMFIIDLAQSAASRNQNLNPIHINTALKTAGNLLDVVSGRHEPDPLGQPDKTTYLVFRDWASNPATHEFRLVFNHYSWTALTLRERFKLVSGTYQRQQATPSTLFSTSSDVERPSFMRGLKPPESGLDSGMLSSTETRMMSGGHKFAATKCGDTSEDQPGLSAWKYDWTSSPPPPGLSPHVELVRSVDWASTALGPMESWSPQLRFMCNFLMANPAPSVMFWGPDLNMIYNAAYPSIIASKHPRVLGMTPQEGFREAWEGFEPFFKRCQETGQGVFLEHLLTFLDRGFGPQEETYYSFGFMPIFGEDDTIAGWFQTCFETTKHRITERRMSTLLSISETTAAASDLESFWKLLLRAIEKNEHDMPWVVIYAGVDQSEVSTGSDAHTIGSSTTKRFEVLCTIGVDMGHAAAPTRTDIAKGSKGFHPFFGQAAEAQDPLVLFLEDGTLPIDLVVGLDTRGWCDPCKNAAIFPIRPTTTNPNSTETVLGYLVMGMNTRRPYDEEYRTFHRLFNRQIVTSIASVLLLEEETRRGRTIAEQAALDQRKFEEQLSLRTRELERSREQLQNFADCVPVGIFVLAFNPGNMDGTYQYRNERWFELTGDSRDNNIGSDSPIWDRMNPEDVPVVRRAWNAVRTTKTSISFEFRVAQRSQYVGVQEHQLDPQGDIDCTWILCYAFSVWDDDGTLRSVIGSITDITPQKYAEIIQKRRMEDAIEAQRRQETFIDVTSHEMRNPLSAIMISADDIMTSLRTLKTNDPTMSPESEELVDSSIDAAGTVSHCAQHQKTIVDDILTISKLDSGLFSITPVEVQPLAIIKDLLKMFEGELQTAKITQKTHIDDSFHDLALDWVLLDPSRLLQILINLVTNSIKFTQLQERRIVTIHMAASRGKPAESVSGIEYLPLRKEREDLTNRPEWGKGESLYLCFAVEDTGCGLTADEKKLLFLRFSQAPRTHVNYGGSGLGLFICRELAEMQGGSIGVASEAGQGSTFAFYIKARRCEHVPTETQTSKQALSDPHSPHVNNLRRSAACRNKVQEPLSARQECAAPGGSLPSDSSAPPESTNASHVYDILITEDNVINQQVLSKQLLKLGHRVSIANQGQEALDFLRKTRYWKGNESDGKNLDVVLMDIEMPVMNGLECVSKIRKLERDGSLVRPVQVIAITANARVEQIDKALDAGMDDVISKPFRMPELIACIERLLETSQSTSDSGE